MRSRPSARLARKASSRFGPDDALGVGARERVAGAAFRHELPACRRSGWRCRRPSTAAAGRARARGQPAAQASAAARRARGALRRSEGRSSGRLRIACEAHQRRNTIPSSGCLGGAPRPPARRSSGPLERARARRCAAAITPRATLSQDQRSRTVAHETRARLRRSSAVGARASPPRARRSPARRRRRPGRRARPAASARQRAASASLTSARPECAALIGQHAAGGRLGGDHPERLREGARHDQRLARGQQLDQLVVLEAPGEARTRSRERARRARGSARAPRRRGSRGTRAGGERLRGRARECSALAPPRAPCPRSAISPRPSRSPRASAASRRSSAVAVGAEADDHQPRARQALEHERPGGEQQVDALADDQLADERDEPVAVAVEALERLAAARVVAGEGARLAPAPAARRARRAAARSRARAPHAAAAARCSRGAKRATSTPGGPSRVRSRARRRRAPPTGSRGVARADEHRARARDALAGKAEKALRLGLDGVLERAAVHLDGIRQLARPAPRARITGPITRWLASASCGRASSASSRTAATFASM